MGFGIVGKVCVMCCCNSIISTTTIQVFAESVSFHCHPSTHHFPGGIWHRVSDGEEQKKGEESRERTMERQEEGEKVAYIKAIFTDICALVLGEPL